MDRNVKAAPQDAEMPANDGFFPWFLRDVNWSRAGLPLAAVLFLLGPIANMGWGRAAFLVYLQLPIYMLHQYEEHAHGAFKRYANRLLAGRGRLTDRKIFWINMLGVWGADLGVLYLARFVNRATGLIAPYLAVVNGLLHLGDALGERRYNPGLWTSLALLLPAGSVSAAVIGRDCRASRGEHGRALAAAILIHVLIAVSSLRGDRR